MSTNANIAIIENNKLIHIYCHWDGYKEYTREMLKTYYTDPVKVKNLINLGAISILNEELYPDDNEPHDFYSSQPNVTIAYFRDRGDSYDSCFSKPKSLKNKKAVLEKYRTSNTFTYIYNMDPNIKDFPLHTWYFSSYYMKEFKKL